MPNSKQSKKRMVQDERKRLANKAKSSQMKSAIKTVVSAESKTAAEAALPEAMKRIDKAAKKNIIHANTAARKKAQIAKAIAKK